MNNITEQLNEIIGNSKAQKLAEAINADLYIPKIKKRDERVVLMRLMDCMEDYFSGSASMAEIISENNFEPWQSRRLRGWAAYSKNLHIKSVFDLFYALGMFNERTQSKLETIVDIIGTGATAALLEAFGGKTLQLQKYNNNSERKEKHDRRKNNEWFC